MNYTCLLEQEFEQGIYKIVPVRQNDRHDIRKWRNEQIFHLRQQKLLSAEEQDNYFENVVAKLFEKKNPDQILFSYLENDVCIGYGGLVHINWQDQYAEISFIMDTSLEEKFFEKHWKQFLLLLQKVAFDSLLFHKIFTYAFDLRPRLYVALETADFIKEAVLKEHCFFEGKFIDVVIHIKLNHKG